MKFKGKDCISHMPHRLAEMDKRAHNSCKQRALSLPRHCPHRGWSVAGIFYIGEVGVPLSVTKQILLPNSQKRFLGEANSAYQAVFSPPMHKSLGTRLE